MTTAKLYFWYLYTAFACAWGGLLLGVGAWVAGPICLTFGLLVLLLHTHEVRSSSNDDRG